MRCAIYCDHCHHIQAWIESASAGGVPTGQIMTGPGYVRCERAVERFLRKFPQATGVLQPSCPH